MDTVGLYEIIKALPGTLQVFPTENYYYFYYVKCGSIYKGNIKFDFFFHNIKPQVSIAVEQYANPYVRYYYNDRKIWILKQDSLLHLEKLSEYVWKVKLLNRFQKIIVFKEIPVTTTINYGEFLFNTLDESGIIFTLVYDTSSRRLLWFLSDTQFTNIHIVNYKDNVYFEPISGFVFLKFKSYFILVGVPYFNVLLNNWWDGPLDQLNDRNWNEKLRSIVESNYLKEANLKLDKYLYYIRNGMRWRKVFTSYVLYNSLDELYTKLKNLNCTRQDLKAPQISGCFRRLFKIK